MSAHFIQRLDALTRRIEAVEQENALVRQLLDNALLQSKPTLRLPEKPKAA